MIPMIWHSAKGKSMETIKKKSVGASGGGEEPVIHEQVDFLGGESIWCNVAMMDTCQWSFV